MVKQIIAGILEDVVGEYVLNISKENIKVAALRGQIKFDNVQLDGDLIGSHVLGAVGLSGFGVLSCWARSLQISIPWTALEREPTRFDISGVHLLCVPLLPSTAQCLGGTTQSRVDPRCTLRTRAKRAALARYERNFFSGRLPGEGPTPQRRRRQLQQQQRSRTRSSRPKNGNQGKGYGSDMDAYDDDMEDDDGSYDHDDDEDTSWMDSEYDDSEDEEDDEEEVNESAAARQRRRRRRRGSSKKRQKRPQEGKHKPTAERQDWKGKFRAKIFRNMEATVQNVHIRCEVPEGSVGDFDAGNSNSSRAGIDHQSSAFSFGCSMESFVIRSCNAHWETTTTTPPPTTTKSTKPESAENNKSRSSTKTLDGYKIVQIQNMGLYWDDAPSLLLCDQFLWGGEPNEETAAHIAQIMSSMRLHQNSPFSSSSSNPLPAKKGRKNSPPRPSVEQAPRSSHQTPHQYICEPFSLRLKTVMTDAGQPRCTANLVPCHLNLELRPHQCQQYKRLRSTMFSQRRLDTMLHQRPRKRPTQDPRSWWKYVINCIMTRPTTRPWRDVLRITTSRKRYLHLVANKLANASHGNGFHGGLTESESAELLALEELLPIEALLAFHLIAMRQFYLARCGARGRGDASRMTSGRHRSVSALTRLRWALGTGRERSADSRGNWGNGGACDADVTLSSIPSVTSSKTDKDEDDSPPLQFFFSINRVSATISIRSTRDRRMLLAQIYCSAEIRLLGHGRRKLRLDLSKLDVLDCTRKSEGEMIVMSRPKGIETLGTPIERKTNDSVATMDESSIMLGDVDDLELPKQGILSQIQISMSPTGLSVDISAHPTYVVWSKACADAHAEFFPRPARGAPSVFREQLRNAATPLAHRAQLALSSSRYLSIRMHASAPKLWIPVSDEDSDGALLLDAGHIRMGFWKPEKKDSSSWQFDASDTQVMIAHHTAVVLQQLGQMNGKAVDILAVPGVNQVIHPFNVHVDAALVGEKLVGDSPVRTSPEQGDISLIRMDVTPVFLSLVDMDVLAGAIGKWYASEVLRVRARTSRQQLSQTRDGLAQTLLMPKLLDVVVSVERIELALEGFSNPTGVELDVRKKYCCELSTVRMKWSERGKDSLTSFVVADAKIVETDGMRLADPNERHRQVLVRGTHEQGGKETTPTAVLGTTSLEKDYADSPIVRASYAQNRDDHIDEVEIDVDSVLVRVTPTTLRDFSQGLRRAIELLEVITREMERKAHEGHRTAGKRDNSAKSHVHHGTHPRNGSSLLRPSDSRILFRLTLKNAALLAGQPIREAEVDQTAVVQILSDALIMFQSVENLDSSGSKTLHVSVQHSSVSINTAFEVVSVWQVPPMIGPTAAEVRAVYGTENFGSVVSQDFSFDCETIQACLNPSDMGVLAGLGRRVAEQIRFLTSRDQVDVDDSDSSADQGLGSVLQYRKKGTGIATSFQLELQALSFVVMKTFETNTGSRPLFDLNVDQVKAKLEGCISALTGELSSLISVSFFNPDIADWEDAIEPFKLLVVGEQMPDEMTLNVKTGNVVHANFTGVLCAELVALLRKGKASQKGSSRRGSGQRASMTPAAISTVGLRRARESSAASILNKSGIDILLCPMSLLRSSKSQQPKDQNSWFPVKDGDKVRLESEPNTGRRVSSTVPSLLALKIPRSSELTTGRRNVLVDLPVVTDRGKATTLHRLIPSQNLNTSSRDADLYEMEPVVEWCMQNQRLHPSLVDAFSVEKGSDLLSTEFWSPSDQLDSHHARPRGRHIPKPPASPPKSLEYANKHRLNTGLSTEGNWVFPYLNNDSPEWTDMTCSLKMARDRVMLPDDSWIWANDWTVDIQGGYGVTTDADGWEYEVDFENFTRQRRFYKRQDACRRRRWTRTRMLKPPRLDDPKRQLLLLWESSREENGDIAITVRSHLTLKNQTSCSLTFFVTSVSWDEEVCLGETDPGQDLFVPVQYATASHVRLALPLREESPNCDPCSLANFQVSEKLLILPTSHTANSVLRTSIPGEAAIAEAAKPDDLHFIVRVCSAEGITDVSVEPVLRLINLLPCDLQFRFGEMPLGEDSFDNGHKSTQVIAAREGASIVASGCEEKWVSLNPKRRPRISVKIPGYRWSKWQRIVNRRKDGSWRPTANEEAKQFRAAKDDVDHVDEYKTVLSLQRSREDGDRCHIIFSVEVGHCPTLRFYSQYWIVDKTGLALVFTDGFTDILGNAPDEATMRRSYMVTESLRSSVMLDDMRLNGHQWSMGMNGMSLFFSRKERIAISIERDSEALEAKSLRCKWTSSMDVSTVLPKTVFSIDEEEGTKRFELGLSVALCQSDRFSRSKIITVFCRYKIVNLSPGDVFLTQDGIFDSNLHVPPHGAVPLPAWEDSDLPPKIRLCTGLTAAAGHAVPKADEAWTNGTIQLDRVGITAIRLPGANPMVRKKPMVLQAEVRLATNSQDSAVVVVLWVAANDSQLSPLYLLRNSSPWVIRCCQPLDVPSESKGVGELFSYDGCSPSQECSTTRGALLSPEVSQIMEMEGISCQEHQRVDCGSFDGMAASGRDDIFVWSVRCGETVCFGFDDPGRRRSLEWTCADHVSILKPATATVEVDGMGSRSVITMGDGTQIVCTIRAEGSTKVIEFVEVGSNETESLHQRTGDAFSSLDEEEYVSIKVRIDLPGLAISVVDNALPEVSGREILLLQADRSLLEFSQSSEGYHEMELRLMSLQLDNHVFKSVHPVLIFCPKQGNNEPFLHVSAVRRLQRKSSAYVFRYIAVRVLDVELLLDRRTAETIARFVQPLRKLRHRSQEDPYEWITDFTRLISSRGNGITSGNASMSEMLPAANAGRCYFEQLTLHPLRLSLTFSQEWMDWNTDTESLMIMQFIRGMASIANAPLTFTSFVVSHAFESPRTLLRIVLAHYSSQLTKQIFGIIGSLAILNGPADFLGNVGTGVIDFFYEPINGMVHGPAQFVEGLEAGTQSLARGVFVGVVRGAAKVTEVVNSNLAGLTADDIFIDERNAHQKLLTDALSRGLAPRTLGNSLLLAGESVARGVKSGALGIVEQPAKYASQHGPAGLLKGFGKAIVGAVVKPAVGLGDGAALVLRHVSEATGMQEPQIRIPMRLRRALPRKFPDKRNSVEMVPYEEQAAKSQKIVTGNESVDDVYLGHTTTVSHLIIASEQSLWAINRRTRDLWCLNWEEISHFALPDWRSIEITIFGSTGVKSHLFHVDSEGERDQLYELLSMQTLRMGNCRKLGPNTHMTPQLSTEKVSCTSHVDGFKAKQHHHVFGGSNKTGTKTPSDLSDEIDVIERCHARMKVLGSESRSFLRAVDEESWRLVVSFGKVFSGLRSRRCLAVGVINGTGGNIQVKSTKLVEGGSPCYSIPSKEFDHDQGVLHGGGTVVFFGWGIVPNLVQSGRVLMDVETNAFVSELSDRKVSATYALARSGYHVGFLEKSFDPNGWWAKYWLLVTRQKDRP